MDQTKTLQLKAENNPLTETARNKTRGENNIETSGTPGGYIGKINIEAESQEETGMETSSGVDSPQGGAAWGRPAPLGGEEPPESVSCPFSSRDFSYLAKIIKILIEKFFANLF
jgi:hypothetical protein